MSRVLYEKRGRRYVPVSEEFMGFPSEGVWIVTAGHLEERRWSGYWIQRCGDVPSVMTHAIFARHQDLIATVIADAMHGKDRLTPNNMARFVVNAVAVAEEGKKK